MLALLLEELPWLSASLRRPRWQPQRANQPQSSPGGGPEAVLDFEKAEREAKAKANEISLNFRAFSGMTFFKPETLTVYLDTQNCQRKRLHPSFGREES